MVLCTHVPFTIVKGTCANINELKKEDEYLPELHKKWVEAAADILTSAPAHLPSLREVSHKIPIIDENKRYNYHLP